jgi:hypothetical protein
VGYDRCPVFSPTPHSPRLTSATPVPAAPAGSLTPGARPLAAPALVGLALEPDTPVDRWSQADRLGPAARTRAPAEHNSQAAAPRRRAPGRNIPARVLHRPGTGTDGSSTDADGTPERRFQSQSELGLAPLTRNKPRQPRGQPQTQSSWYSSQVPCCFWLFRCAVASTRVESLPFCIKSTKTGFSLESAALRSRVLLLAPSERLIVGVESVVLLVLRPRKRARGIQ